MIIEENVVNERHPLPSLDLGVFFDEEGKKQIIKIPRKNDKSKVITTDDIKEKEMKRFKGPVEKIEFGIFYHNNKEKKQIFICFLLIIYFI